MALGRLMENDFRVETYSFGFGNTARSLGNRGDSINIVSTDETEFFFFFYYKSRRKLQLSEDIVYVTDKQILSARFGIGHHVPCWTSLFSLPDNFNWTDVERRFILSVEFESMFFFTVSPLQNVLLKIDFYDCRTTRWSLNLIFDSTLRSFFGYYSFQQKSDMVDATFSRETGSPDWPGHRSRVTSRSRGYSSAKRRRPASNSR